MLLATLEDIEVSLGFNCGVSIVDAAGRLIAEAHIPPTLPPWFPTACRILEEVF